VPTFFSTKFIISWSKSLLFFIFHNFMVKINTFLPSGGRGRPASRQNTEWDSFLCRCPLWDKSKWSR
jgi:hypothetical protein